VVLVPQPKEILEDASTNTSDSGGDGEEFQCHTQSHSELKDIRDLGLPNQNAETLGSGLKEKNLLAAETSMYWYRNMEYEFTSYFHRIVT
jgi:hypothetical protein